MLHSRSWIALTLWSPLMDSEFITGCYISHFCWQCISDHDLNSLVCALFILKSQRKMNWEVWYTKFLFFWVFPSSNPLVCVNQVLLLVGKTVFVETSGLLLFHIQCNVKLKWGDLLLACHPNGDEERLPSFQRGLRPKISPLQRALYI